MDRSFGDEEREGLLGFPTHLCKKFPLQVVFRFMFGKNPHGIFPLLSLRAEVVSDPGKLSNSRTIVKMKMLSEPA